MAFYIVIILILTNVKFEKNYHFKFQNTTKLILKKLTLSNFKQCIFKSFLFQSTKIKSTIKTKM